MQEVTVHEGDSSRLMHNLRAKRREQERERQEQMQPDLINQGIENQPVTTINAPAQNEVLAQEIRICTKDGIEGEIFSLSAMFPTNKVEEHPLMAMKATSDPDTMYMHEAMREPDKEEFKQAMKKEWNDQLANGNFVVRHISEIPNNVTILPAVWQMKNYKTLSQQ